jgi:hypothetical protein
MVENRLQDVAKNRPDSVKIEVNQKRSSGRKAAPEDSESGSKALLCDCLGR